MIEKSDGMELCLMVEEQGRPHLRLSCGEKMV